MRNDGGGSQVLLRDDGAPYEHGELPRHQDGRDDQRHGGDRLDARLAVRPVPPHRAISIRASTVPMPGPGRIHGTGTETRTAVPPPAAAKKDDSPGRTLWFPTGKPDQAGGGAQGKLDELAFLKSVTGGEAAPPSAPAPPASPSPAQRARPSGGFKAAEVPAAPPHHPPPPAPAAGPAHAPAPASPPTPAPQPVAARPADPAKDRASQGQKTLKCGECGTLNRPTEWYCERCGAELAAL